MALELDVVVDVDLGGLDAADGESGRRQWLERWCISAREGAAPAAGQLLEGPVVQFEQQLGDGSIDIQQTGLVVACAFFIWRMSTLFSVKPHEPPAGTKLPPGVQVFELYGSLFFGAVGKIEALPDQLPAGTRAVVLEMQRLVSLDTSGVDALEQLHRTAAVHGVPGRTGKPGCPFPKACRQQKRRSARPEAKPP